MDWIVRHRRTKEAETVRPNLNLARQISTLQRLSFNRAGKVVCCSYAKSYNHHFIDPRQNRVYSGLLRISRLYFA